MGHRLNYVDTYCKVVRREVRESPRYTSAANKLSSDEWTKLRMIYNRNNKKLSPFVKEMKKLYEVISHAYLMYQACNLHHGLHLHEPGLSHLPSQHCAGHVCSLT